MKVLGIDIGAGTKDVLLYDSGQSVENCVKMVLPSPTILYVRRIGDAEADLYIDGHTIGGGDLVAELEKHMAKGHRVFMTRRAALTLYNRTSRVAAMGVTIADGPPAEFSGEHVTLDEIGFDQLKRFLSSSLESLDDLDGVAIAVQDHGVPPEGMGQNEFRLKNFKEHFTQRPEVHASAFRSDEIPRHYARMRSAAEAVRKTMPKVRVFVMDSAIAAVSGCLYDRPEPKGDSAVALNVGNSHVTASIVRQHQLVGFMEHHTALLSPYKLVRFLRKLQSRTLTSNEISSDGGHGAFYLDGSTIRGNNVVLVTGPRRRIVEETGLKVRYAAPTGDVMMTGVYGLVKAVERMLR